jgi:hypothetical protein
MGNRDNRALFASVVSSIQINCPRLRHFSFDSPDLVVEQLPSIPNLEFLYLHRETSGPIIIRDDRHICLPKVHTLRIGDYIGCSTMESIA